MRFLQVTHLTVLSLVFFQVSLSRALPAQYHFEITHDRSLRFSLLARSTAGSMRTQADDSKTFGIIRRESLRGGGSRYETEVPTSQGNCFPHDCLPKRVSYALHHPAVKETCRSPQSGVKEAAPLSEASKWQPSPASDLHDNVNLLLLFVLGFGAVWALIAHGKARVALMLPISPAPCTAPLIFFAPASPTVRYQAKVQQ
jgi:hypothetical protein